MRILSVGQMSGQSNTCRLRNEALKRIADTVDVVNTSAITTSYMYRIRNRLFVEGFPVSIPERQDENRKILDYISRNKYDIVWIDKGLTIKPSTLVRIKKEQPQAKLISYSPDNMAERHCQSKQYLEGIDIYDAHITTKSYIIDDLYKLGCKKVIFSNQSYEDSFHFPREITDDDIKRLGADVGFVGAWEKERMESILFLSRNGIRVRIFGFGGWEQCKNDNPNLVIEDHGLFDEDYAKSFKCFKICLCFLRKKNKDVQTSRTMEIPACGGFMLGERTGEHRSLFEEGIEAEFFSDNEELLKKSRFYLEHEKERLEIARRGYERCKKSGYSNYETLKSIIEQL